MSNKKLEELFNLPLNSENEDDGSKKVPTIQEMSIFKEKTLSTLDKIESALPSVKGLESSDKEMDALADLATASYKDLVDLGMNVEPRHSADILSVACSFLGHAITAKTAKLNKKLKMVDLQLRQAKLKKETNPDGSELESGETLDRNELLERILKEKIPK